MVIYRITNTENGKIYVGATSSKIQRRWRQHVNNKCKSLLTDAIKTHGENKFVIDVLDVASSEKELFDKEVIWIEKLGCTNPDIGYNILPGGKKGPVMCGASHPLFGKPNPRFAAIGRARKGVPISESQKAALLKAIKGVPKSDSYKEKMSLALKKRWQQGMYKDVGKKISEAKKGVRVGGVQIICLNNGKVYKSHREAAEDTGVSAGNIPSVISGRLKHTKGFVFQLFEVQKKLSK